MKGLWRWFVQQRINRLLRDTLEPEEMQRILLLLATQPDIFWGDEPTGERDGSTLRLNYSAPPEEGASIRAGSYYRQLIHIDTYHIKVEVDDTGRWLALEGTLWNGTLTLIKAVFTGNRVVNSLEYTYTHKDAFSDREGAAVAKLQNGRLVFSLTGSVEHMRELAVILAGKVAKAMSDAEIARYYLSRSLDRLPAQP